MAVPALIDHPLTTGRGEIRVFLDVFSEGNLPTWWSVGLLVVAVLGFRLAQVAIELLGAVVSAGIPVDEEPGILEIADGLVASGRQAKIADRGR